MARPQHTTVTCPHCKNNLPAWAQTCQFCGAPLRGVGSHSGPIVDTWNDRPTWQEVGYIVCSVIFILIGGLELLQGFKVVPVGAKPISDGYGTYLQFMGTAAAVLGIAMLFQQLWAQFVVKLYSMLALVVALWNLMVSLMMASTLAAIVPTSTIAMIIAMHAFYAVFYGFTIYIIKVVGDVDP